MEHKQQITTVKRRYTSNDGKNNWIVSAAYDAGGLGSMHWLEVSVAATNEGSDESFKFPPEIRTYRIGEVENSFQQSVALDFGGDRDAALDHHLNTIFRRVYSYIERGH